MCLGNVNSVVLVFLCRELHISQVTQSYIELLKDRELVVFKARGNESYVNGDSQITIRNEGICISCCVILSCIFYILVPQKK